MARLDKLLIQGIRSFGPDEGDQQIVAFYTPLTLILGQNGCGKTTIIESLKFAITGELPPGTKNGHGFVYDPKLAKEVEVRGKVQLKMIDVRGKELTVTRGVQLVQKKTNYTFSRIGTAISRLGPDGVPVQISGRCIDADIEMAVSIGVSKSIINNVILCHQEDSSWPLEEAKKLKMRFDAIFDTVKHNKCLEEINSLRKVIKLEVKRLDDSLGHLHDKKQSACRLQNAINDTERAINVARDQVDKCQSRCKPIDDRLQEVITLESHVHGLHTEMEKIKLQIVNIREQKDELKRNISKRYDGTIEDLKDVISQFQSQVQEKEVELRELLSNLEKTEKHEVKLNEDMIQKQKEIGQLELQQQNNKRDIHNRNNCLEKLRKDLDVEGPSVSGQETKVRSILEKVNQKVREMDGATIQLQNELEEEEKRHQNRLESLSETRVKKEQEIKMKEQQIKNKTDQANKIRSDIKEVERAASRLTLVENELSAVETKFEEVTQEINVEELKENLARFEDDERKVNSELGKTYDEIQELQAHATTRTHLNMKQSELNKKEAELKKLKNKNGDTLKHLLGTVPEIGLKRKFDDCLEQIIQDIHKKNAELREVQNEISKIEVNRRHKKEQLDAKEKEIKEDEEKIYEHCENRDLEDVIKDLDDKIQEMRNMKGMLASQEVLFQKYVQKLQEKDPCCPLCHRNFERTEEPASLIDELRSEVRTVPVRLRSNNEKLERSVREYDSLLQLKSTNERLKASKENILPKLKKELKDVENQLKSARENAEDLQNCLLNPQMDEGLARGIQNDIFLMDKYQSEIKTCKTEVSTLQADLPATASTRTLEEAMKIQDDLRKETEELRESIKSNKEILEKHKDKIQKLHERKNKLVEEKLKIQGGTQQLQQMKTTVNELDGDVTDLEEQVILLKSDVTFVKKDCNDARRTLDEVKVNNRGLLKKEEEKMSELKNRLAEIVRLNNNINEYERRGISGELTTSRQAYEDLEHERESLVGRKKSLTEKKDKLKTEISGREVHHRELRDNLQLLEKEKEEEKMVIKKGTFAKKIGENTSYKEIVTERQKLESERNVIIKESQLAEVRVEELQKRLRDQRKEQAEEMYQEADIKYSRALREKMVKERIDSDLNKYQKAMECTMTKFHQERMKVINEIIHDLWRSIYRGNDIDYIKIEANAPDFTSDSTRRRSYDYRVVQVKNDTEIDMRGRCSAGQKVLACLIIRMALAQTLSSQCGILALDEPTTNLDRENIESLAESLAQIVNTRMVNKGFQLILITHDEEFVQHIKQSGQLSRYFIVTRNEGGKSRIKKYAVN